MGVDVQQKGPWRVVSENAVQYLVTTRDIAEWLSEFSIPNTDDDDPDFSGLEKLLAERAAAVEVMKTVDRAALEREAQSEDEKACRKLSLDLLSQISDLEKENEAVMQSFTSKYREKLKNIKQARETMTAYNQAQAYSAPVDALGHHFNQAN